MANEIYLTEEGREKLIEKLNEYKTVKRPAAIEAIGVAREFGDLKENSEYDQAKEEQGKIEAEITQMENTLRDAIIIKTKKSNGSVHLGSKVTLLDVEENEKLVYQIVGSFESNPIEGLISNESPVGAALLGKEKGEDICVHTPAGEIKYTILEIK